MWSQSYVWQKLPLNFSEFLHMSRVCSQFSRQQRFWCGRGQASSLQSLADVICFPLLMIQHDSIILYMSINVYPINPFKHVQHCSTQLHRKHSLQSLLKQGLKGTIQAQMSERRSSDWKAKICILHRNSWFISFDSRLINISYTPSHGLDIFTYPPGHHLAHCLDILP